MSFALLLAAAIQCGSQWPAVVSPSSLATWVLCARDEAVSPPPSCVATTSVPEFKDQIERACQPGLISIDISGDHDTLVKAIVLDRDFKDREFDGGQTTSVAAYLVHLAAAQAARDSAVLLDAIYPMRLFVLEVRDRQKRPLCRFEVTDEETTGRCASKVK